MNDMQDVAADLQLLDDIAQGKESAMEQFYRRYNDAVYRFAYKVLQNPIDSAEVLNEVMMAVWEKPDAFSGKSKITTWLYKITHNKAVDAVRRKARHDHVGEYHADMSDHQQAEEHQGCALFDVQAGLENQQYVNTCMDKLSDDHRHVVYLTFYEGLSYSDIADIVAAPAGTIKTRMMHAKKQLMQCIERLLGR